jgi:hypothetical protein
VGHIARPEYHLATLDVDVAADRLAFADLRDDASRVKAAELRDAILRVAELAPVGVPERVQVRDGLADQIALALPSGLGRCSDSDGRPM